MTDSAFPVPRGPSQPVSSLAAAVAAHSRGEPGARDQLLGACRAQIEKLARRLLGSHPEIRRGAHDTQDIVQESWLKLARAIQSERPESEQHLLSLARMQVRRIVIDLSRKFGGPRSPVRNQKTNVVAHGGHLIERVNEAAEVADGLDSIDMTTFHEEVDQLPTELRDVFEQRYYLGARVKEIARFVGCDPRTVKRRWKLAKEKLQTRLGHRVSGVSRSPE